MRTPRTIRLVLATLLAVMLLGGSASGLSIVLPKITWTQKAISDSSSVKERLPVIDGHLIAWEHGDQIAVRNLRTNETRIVPLQPGT